MGNAEVSIRILAGVPLKEIVQNRFAAVEHLPIVKRLKQLDNRHPLPVRFGVSGAKLLVGRGGLAQLCGWGRGAGNSLEKQLEVALGELNAAEPGKYLLGFLGKSGF